MWLAKLRWCVRNHLQINCGELDLYIVQTATTVIFEQLCIHYDIQRLSCVDNHGCYMDNGVG
jgi:hypothetical protein